MVDHAEGIRNILSVITGYSGGYSPVNRGINEVNASNKFFVSMGEELLSETHWTSEQYKITLQASSEANLHALKNALLNCATDRPSGFIPGTTTSTHYSMDSSQGFHLRDLGGSENYPIAAGQTANTYIKVAATTAFDIYWEPSPNQTSAALNFPVMYNNFSAVRIGLHGNGSSGGTVDFTIHTILNNTGVYDGAADPGEKITVGAEKTAIGAWDDDGWNEFTVTDLCSEILTTFPVDTYFKFFIGAASDTGEKDLCFWNKADYYPYIEYDLDTTATGYPYWIGFTSPNKPRHMGPNTYTMDLTLLASYEVTS